MVALERTAADEAQGGLKVAESDVQEALAIAAQGSDTALPACIRIWSTDFSDDLALAAWLLEQELVATVPGTAFGTPGFLRISYATDDDSLREGLGRLQRAFAGLPTGR